MRLNLFFVSFCLLSVVPLSGQVRIDPAKAVIRVTNSKANQVAADELKMHLELITDTAISVVDVEQISPASFVFHVGVVPEGREADLKPEEACWLVTPSAAWFYGGEHNGVQNAVYSFLEDALGVRWPFYDDIAYQKQNPLVLNKLEGHWLPEITYRSFRDYNKGTPPEQTIWKQRLRRGTDGSWNYGPGDALYGKWWKRYGKDHPEYFAMNINGVRGPAPTRLKGAPADDPTAYAGSDLLVAFCCTNDALLDAVIDNWDKKDWLNFFQPDLYDFESCYCENCRALDAIQVKPGEKFSGNNLSDRYVHMMNRLYEKARKINPNVKVISGMYNFAEQPPKRQKIEGNIYFSAVPTDFTMEGLKELIGGWKKAGLQKMYYRPNRHGYFLTLIPVGYEKYFHGVFQYMYKAGALGFDYDVAGTFLHAGQWLSDYVLLKGTQDPSKTFEELEQHYMQAFAPAEREISDYYGYWRHEVWEKRLEKDIKHLAEIGRYFNFGRGLARNFEKYYSEADFDETDRILRRALQRPDLPANVRERIEYLVVDNTHARLTFQAIVKNVDSNSIALMEFRKKHGYPLKPWCEQYWGDICGIKRAQQFEEFSPPYIRTELFWFFKLDPEDIGLSEGWFKDTKLAQWGEYMPVNNHWEAPLAHYQYPSTSMREKTANYDGIAWYALELKNLPEDWKDREVFLYFEAVDESCQIWVNGKKAGEHLYQNPDDWRNPFSIPINECLVDKGSQTVIVRVEDKSGGGGIWKPVWLVSKLLR
ncbi:MAG: DUF4838 domain-containing protein [Lentisphaeria bacterium]